VSRERHGSGADLAVARDGASWVPTIPVMGVPPAAKTCALPAISIASAHFWT
jgi:hypothetical protein